MCAEWQRGQAAPAAAYCGAEAAYLSVSLTRGGTLCARPTSPDPSAVTLWCRDAPSPRSLRFPNFGTA